MSDFTKSELQELHSALCDRHENISDFVPSNPLIEKIQQLLARHHERPTVDELRREYQVAPFNNEAQEARLKRKYLEAFKVGPDDVEGYDSLCSSDLYKKLHNEMESRGESTYHIPHVTWFYLEDERTRHG